MKYRNLLEKLSKMTDFELDKKVLVHDVVKDTFKPVISVEKTRINHPLIANQYALDI